MSARKRRATHEEEEHVNHERWLVSYADMVTLLMCLFIVMFAISNVDAKKFAALKAGFHSGFGQSVNVPITGGTGFLTTDGNTPDPLDLVLPAEAPSEAVVEEAESIVAAAERSAAQARRLAAEAEVDSLEAIQTAIAEALAAEGLADRAKFRITEDGLVVAVVADDVFFANASAALRPTGTRVLEAVGPVLRPLPNDIDVEGHANHLPLTSGIYPSNWELSAARSATVVRFLSGAQGVADVRLTAAGHGASRPLVPEDDPRAIETNRRVDLVIVSTQPADVRVLLPAIAAARDAG